MSMVGAQPAKGPTLTWEVMSGLSPQTAQFLHGKFRLWSRLYEGQHRFVALPINQRADHATEGYPGIHEALVAVGQRQ